MDGSSRHYSSLAFESNVLVWLRKEMFAVIKSVCNRTSEVHLKVGLEKEVYGSSPALLV